jgi:hypothetical protein
VRFKRGNQVQRTTGNMHDTSNIDSHLKGMIDKVTQAGSWAVWMGVFSRGWMDMYVDSRWNDVSQCL